ncbi:20353_t:CDS:2, partial [Dentiscutata erythropus]
MVGDPKSGEYAAPENPETEPKKDRENRLKNKRNAKYRYYQTLEEGNSGPSTRTRSRTSKTSSDSRSKTKEGQRDRQRAHRASLRYCSLDEYQEEVEDNNRDNNEDDDGDNDGDDDEDDNRDDDGDNDGDDSGDDSDDDDDDDNDGDDKKNIGGHSVGKMNIECKYCGALRWKGEKPRLCCMNGEVVLAPLQAPPPKILYFLTEKDPISK